MIHPDIVERIKASVNCPDLLEPSKNRMFCCPLCGSGHGIHGTGAVKHYPESNTWHCFSCNTGGDVIDLYRHQTGAGFEEAINALAARAGISIDASKAKKPPLTGDRARKDECIMDDIKTPENAPQARIDYTEYYNKSAERLDDPAALSYLTGRGISTETARLFNIGYDPEADPATAPGAISDSGKKYSRPRIIIPCTQDFYIARAVQPDCPQQYKAPNPKGSQTALFNERALETERAVFVVEGVFDALAVIECGEPAVALNGKGNGRLLLQALKKTRNRPGFIICPDNDADPNTASDTLQTAKELCHDLQAAGYKAIICNAAGSCKDLNDALQADRAQFEEALTAAVKELLRNELDDFWDAIQNEKYKPNKTGLKFFDYLTGGGIVNQSLLLLAAAPGTGKTTLAQQIAESIAGHGRPIIFLNFEMAREQLLAKAISARLHNRGYYKTAMQVLQGYRWTPQDRKWIEEAIRDYRAEQYPFIRYNPDGVTSNLDSLLDYLQAAGARARAEGKQAPAAVIDYLHLITTTERIDTAELLKRAVTGLKQYAIDFDTFVIAIIATNRIGNSGGRLRMDHARDTSNLEYTADYHITLNYAAVEDGEDRSRIEEELALAGSAAKRDMILRIEKNRFGVPGKYAKVYFDAANSLFYGQTKTSATVPKQYDII